ncbi:MAG TPA: hypothetical protein VFG10_13410 [Saprospiraceae bacterium]|nr:hypothetical protein [Saprospiraceae bacterium]
MGIYHQDIILLRWSPAEYDVYQQSLSNGFRLERGLYSSSGILLSKEEYENSITILQDKIQLIEANAWEGVEAPSSVKDAAIELFYNYHHTLPEVDSVNVFSALEEEENKNSLLAFASIIADRDYEAAEAIGWAYKDNSIEVDKQYIYILTLLETDEKYYTIVSTSDKYDLPRLPKPRAVPGISIAALSFSTVGKDDYYAYYIQRSGDLGSNYELVRELPIMFDDQESPGIFRYVDSLPDNENLYCYRFAGVTAFGLQGSWSDTIRVRGLNGPLDAAPDISEIVKQGTGVDITFTFPDSLEDKITRFEVIRSIKREGPFLKLTDELEPDDREFHDDSPLYSNFYFIRAIDENGFPLLSLPQYYAPVDTIAPAIPSGLGGQISVEQYATLHWGVNNDFDIKGYKIYASNAEEGQYTEITDGPVRDTTFQYQLGRNLMNEEWFIKIRAVDLNENESQISEPVMLSRPDAFPPTEPVLKDITSLVNGIGMNWIKSYSEDVVLHVLQRREIGNGGWSTILNITNDYEGLNTTKDWNGSSLIKFNFLDTSVVAKHEYQYRVKAIDDAGNFSYSAILDAIGYDDGIRGEIYNLEAINKPYTITTTTAYSPSKDSVSVAVGWDYTDTIGVHHFLIYRSAGNWPFKLYKSYLAYDDRPNPAASTDNAFLSAPTSGLTTKYVFVDKQTKFGTRYSYRIIAKHLDGGFSRMSEIVSVTTSSASPGH